MLYLSPEDFFKKVATVSRLHREEEKELARQMAAGNTGAADRLAESYLPQVAGHIRRLPAQYQTLSLVYACLKMLDTAVSSFDFLQDGEPFSHRLSWYLRQCSTRHIADCCND